MHQQLALSLSSIALIIEMFFMVYAGGGAGVGVWGRAYQLYPRAPLQASDPF